MLKKLKNLLEAKLPAPRLPYVAEYSVPATGATIDDIKFADFPGLFILHAVRCDAGVKALAYWGTHEQFHCYGTRLGASLNAAADPVHGTVFGLKTRSKPLWARMQFYTGLLALVAVLGAAKSLFDHLDWLFADPDLALSSDPMEIRVAENNNFSAILTITNRSPVAESDIHVSAFLQPSAERKISIDFNDLKLSSLKEGASYTTRLTGRGIAAGKFRIGIKARAKAGRVWPAQEFRADIPIEVWPVIPQAAVFSNNAKDIAGLIGARIRVGPAAPKGLECALEIKRVRGLDYKGRNAWSKNETPGQESYVLSFSTGPLPEFSFKDVQYQFESRQPQDWAEVAKRSRLDCRNLEG